MKEFEIGASDAGKRLDRWMQQSLTALPTSLAQKFIRTKRIRINGKVAKLDTHIAQGDRLQIYIDDAYFETPAPAKPSNPLLAGFHPHLRIVYEDARILLADKQPGLLTHPDEREKVNTLLTHVRAHLYQHGEWDGDPSSPDAPALCNRIDRFTGGLVIAAKGGEAARRMDQKIRAGEVEKRYLCIVRGSLPRPEGVLDMYLFKPEGARRVQALANSVPGAQRAVTGYRRLAARGELTLVECHLMTGRTHQIRAQFAAVGNPLLGDNQYGDARFNARYAMEQQALYAYRVAFRFSAPDDLLSDLNGRAFSVARVPFVEEFFPEINLRDL